MTAGFEPEHVDLGVLIKDLYRDADGEAALATLVDRSITLMDGCDYAGVTLATRAGLHTVCASDVFVEELDQIQYDLKEGPCITALEGDRVAIAPDTSSDQRWPRFTDALAERGVRSLLAYPLDDQHQGSAVGALNLYGRERNAFTDRDRVLGSVLAAAASVALSAARQLSSLNDALQTREAIGIAKGILMARNGVTDDEAFAMLRKASQHGNERLRDVAIRVVGGGRLANEPGGLRCVACGERVPLADIESGPGVPLAYTCPSCRKRTEFAPAAAFSRRLKALVQERDRLVAERDKLLGRGTD